MKKAKYLGGEAVGSLCDTFGIETNKAKSRQKKNADANEWIPTEAVKKIKEIQAYQYEKHEGKMTETCVSNLLYEFNIIWRNIMRKENEAIKKAATL